MLTPSARGHGRTRRESLNDWGARCSPQRAGDRCSPQGEPAVSGGIWTLFAEAQTSEQTPDASRGRLSHSAGRYGDVVEGGYA